MEKKTLKKNQNFAFQDIYLSFGCCLTENIHVYTQREPKIAKMLKQLDNRFSSERVLQDLSFLQFK